MRRTDDHGVPASHFRCESCRHDQPGKRYQHFLRFDGAAALEDHLKGEGVGEGMRGSIMSWYHTVVSMYAQEAKDARQSVELTWRNANNEARYGHYTIRDQDHVDEVVRDFYSDMVDLGVDESQVVSWAKQRVWRYLNA